MSIEIVAALLRRDGEFLLVEQAGPGEEPAWSVPAGRVEPGEERLDALRREVLEETGLTMVDPGTLAFVVEVDDGRHGWSGTLWTWDVAAWEGERAPSDPDGFVLQAAWVPVEEAVRRLEDVAWHALTIRAFRGELQRGSRWRRVVEPGGDETLSPA